MQYLIKSKAIDNVIAGPPEQAVSMAENVAIPSLKMLAEGERSKKFVGGAIAGQRGWAIIADFSNHEEANRWVMSLPFWSVEVVEIIPLVSFQSQADSIGKLAQGFKSMLKK
jgi:hypothetical protein